MAEIYSHVKDDKVVLSLRGREAVQYVSNAELMRLGRQVVESVQAARAAEAELERAEVESKRAEAESERAERESKRAEDHADNERSVTSAKEVVVHEGVVGTNKEPAPVECEAGSARDGPHFHDGLSSDSDLEIRFATLSL